MIGCERKESREEREREREEKEEERKREEKKEKRREEKNREERRESYILCECEVQSRVVLQTMLLCFI